MGESSVIFHGVREFDDAVRADEAKLLEAARNIVSKGSLIIAGEAKKVFRPFPGGQKVHVRGKDAGKTYYSFVAPYQATPPVPTRRSGNLQDSIGTFYRVTKIEGGWMSVTGPKQDIKYAPYVEFGTSHMQKEPYMSVGVDRSKDEIERLAEYEWAKAVA